MPRLRAPGVYFEPADPPTRRVGEVRTDVAGFVGAAERGPVDVPVRVQNWTQFATRFGGPTDAGFLAYAVRGYFANGGRACWVVRVGDDDGRRASLVLADRFGRPTFRVAARDPGPATTGITIRVEPAVDDRFTLAVELDDDAAGGQAKTAEVWRDLDPVKFGPDGKTPTARYAGGDLVNGRTIGAAEPNQPDEAERSIGGSVFITIEDLGAGGSAHDRLPVGVKAAAQTRARLLWESAAGKAFEYTSAATPGGPAKVGRLGAESLPGPVLARLTLDHFTGENQPLGAYRGLKALERVEEVAVVAIPDLMWPGDAAPARPRPRPRRCEVIADPAEPSPPRPVVVADDRPPLSGDDRRRGQEAILRHCAALRDRFAVLDAPAGLTADRAIAWAAGLRSEFGQFAGLYYPWVLAPEPRPIPAAVRPVPPSGHVAGMFARVDLTVGVHKPPANELLEEVRAAERDLTADEHGWLNDEGVNAIRAYPGRGVRVAGARTLVPPADPELRPWRFVNVRRLLLMFAEAIDRSTQWVVFGGNGPDTWRDVDRVVRAFLADQWRRGRLDGATADEAFQVTCDRTTNPPPDVDAGRLVCELRVRPPQPAELVIVRLGRRVGETGVVELAGGDRG
jgi:phage tail sheath protein FI